MRVAADQTYNSEMGFTHAELLKGLASAVEPFVVNKIESNNYILSWEDRVAKLHLAPESTRNIASIKLPVTEITIEFENFSEDHWLAFLDRFKKYLHRGGG